MKRIALLLFVVAVVVGAGCRRQAPDSEVAVEAAIRAHLSQRSDLAMEKMTVEVEKVEFKGETAEADVVFRLKDTPGTMAYHYTLLRKGEKWVVERGRGGGMSGAEIPLGHPPVGGPPSSPQTLPRTTKP